MPQDTPTAYLQECLDRLRAGDASARKDLVNSACRRLSQLTRAMLKDYPRLQRWEETDDVFQGAMVRLYRALAEVTPASPQDFYRLAALQIRRELVDLTRHYFGPHGPGSHRAPGPDGRPADSTDRPGGEPAQSTFEPSRLAVWSEFHRQVQALTDDQREVMDLVWYQGLTHTDAALVLGVSARTVKRRWQEACLKLHQVLGGDFPGT